MLAVLAIGAAPVGAAPSVLPARDTGLGFYYVEDMQKDRGREAAELQDMAARGCNTLTVYFRNPGEIARQLDGALEAGLLDRRFPVCLLNNSPLKTGEAARQARLLGKRVAEWPTLCNYGPDEIPAGRRVGLETWIREENVPHLPVVVASDAAAVTEYADLLDMALVIDHGCTPEVQAALRAQGHSFAAYTIATHVQGTELYVRYLVGLWAWKTRPRVLLAWCYHDTLADAPGDRRLRAWQEGALDYRILLGLEQAITAHPERPEAAAARAWLDNLRRRIVTPTSEWVGRPPTYADVYAVNQQPPPLVNFGMIRQWAGYYLAALTGTENAW